jgi:hypothetical protein
MAHYAQLDENNVVIQVIVVHNNELVISKQATVNEDGSVSVSVIESEDKGIEFCKSLFGADTKWVQTSYNASFRGKYAGIGDTYNATDNIFVSPVVETVQQDNQQTQETQQIDQTQTIDIQSLTTTDLQSLTTTGL